MLTKCELVEILTHYKIDVKNLTKRQILRELTGKTTPKKRDLTKITHRPDLKVREQIIYMCEHGKLSLLTKRKKISMSDLGIIDNELSEPRLKSIKELLNKQTTYLTEDFSTETITKFTTSSNLCNLPFIFKDFKLLGRGAYGVVFEGCIENEVTSPSTCPYKVAIKIAGFRKEISDDEGYELLSITDKRRPELVEWEIQTRLHETLSKMQSIPHVPWPFLNFLCDVSNKSFLNILLKQAGFNIKLFLPKFRVSIVEFIPMGDLEQFFDITDDDKTQDVLYILFQVLMSLAQLHSVYPSFIHNDLHTGNILLKPVPKDAILKYQLNNKLYKIKSLGYIALLNDFDFAEIRPEITNAKGEDFFGKKRVLLNYTDVYRFTGAYYDLLYRDLKIKTTTRCKKFIAEISQADKRMDFERLNGEKTKKEQKVSKKIDYDKFTPEKLINKPIFANFIEE